MYTTNDSHQAKCDCGRCRRRSRASATQTVLSRTPTEMDSKRSLAEELGEQNFEQQLVAAYYTKFTPTKVPTPGHFYAIQYGKGGLLTTVGKAYQIGSGAERLKLAQRVNNHPLNQKFWISPQNAFEKKYFPQGIIAFNKIFNCDAAQRRAVKGKSTCYARIYIPSREIAYHPIYGQLIPLPIPPAQVETEAGKKTDQTLRAIQWFHKFIECNKQPTTFDPFSKPFKRTLEEATAAAPSRWIAGLVCFFENIKNKNEVWVLPSEGTAFFISGKYMLTAAHNLSIAATYADGSTYHQKPIFAIITPGQSGIDSDGLQALDMPQAAIAEKRTGCRGTGEEPSLPDLFPDPAAQPAARPFGDIFLPRVDDNTFRIPPEYKPAKSRFDIDTKNDFGLIHLAGATLFGTRPKGFWGVPAETMVQKEKTMVESTIVVSGNTLATTNLKVTGYPNDKCCEQWTADGILDRAKDGVLELSHLRAPAGNSGGPVYTAETVTKVVKPGVKIAVKRLRLLGIFSSSEARIDKSGITYSGKALAVQITARVDKILKTWMADDAQKRARRQPKRSAPRP